MPYSYILLCFSVIIAITLTQTVREVKYGIVNGLSVEARVGEVHVNGVNRVEDNLKSAKNNDCDYQGDALL